MIDIPQIQIHEAKKKLEEKASIFVDIRDPGSDVVKIMRAGETL